jgi:hypothetical protein
MRLISDNDTRTFTDAAGDSLTLLVAVRHRDALKRDQLENTEALDALKGLGLGIKDAMQMERDATPEDLAAARARKAESKDEHSAASRRFMLSAVAITLTIRGEDIGGNAILEAYDRMDPESAAWVDAQVATVWKGATLGDDERAKLGGSPGTA